MDGLVVVPPARGAGGYVSLSRSQKGRLFEKHILSFGELIYPGVKGGKVNIDQNFADTLVKNFEDKVCDIVQVPLAGANNEHTEDPTRNIGEVVGIKVRDKKIYAVLDAREEIYASRLGTTLLGASAMLHLNYKDTRTGKGMGPTLLHVAVTNRPYVLDLEDFSEVLAASADGTSEGAVVLTAPTTEDNMDLDQMLAALREDHGIDVAALQTKAAAADDAMALSNKIQEELVSTGLLTLSSGQEVTADTLIGAVAEAGTQIAALSGKVESLEKTSNEDKAKARIDSLVRDGKILPKNAAAQVKLLLSNPDLFEELLPEKAIVRLSQESGTEPVDDEHKNTVDAEVARLTASTAAAAYVQA